MYSFINCTFHRILLELWKEGRWMAGSCRVCVTWGMFTGLSEILNNNNNEWSSPLLAAYTCTKLQTWLYSQCCYGWLNSLSHTLLHSHCSRTINISAVVMLGFCWGQFCTGSLAWVFGLLSTTKCFVWLFQFSICVLGYGWWCLSLEFHWVSFVPL